MLVPYRYPRHAMWRMPDLVKHAAAAGARIMNLSMGSRRLSDWTDFEVAARAHPAMLFVVSAGNEGADIDETPVYPASLTVDNLLTVTSADDSGLPARGSNRGRESVDLAVPAEQVLVTDFDGRVRKVSGSSYAAARVSALAACLLAAHPEWTALDLKSAILARAEKPASAMPAYAGTGTLRDPTGSDRGACDARLGNVTEVPLGVWTPGRLHAEGAEPARTHVIALDLVILSGAGWRIPEIHRALGRAADILAQCGVSVARARVRMVEAPRRFRYLDDRWSRGLVRRLEPARPAVFFVEETLREPAFEAEAFGRRNTRRMPAMRDTVWITSAAKEDLGGRARARAVPRPRGPRPARGRSRQPHARAHGRPQHPALRLAVRAAAQGGDGVRAGGTAAVAAMFPRSTAAVADPAVSAVLNAARGLDVPSSTPARADSRSPCRSRAPGALASRIGETRRSGAGHGGGTRSSAPCNDIYVRIHV